ncbi:MAG TPA: V-type ATP synthase subunit D [Rectinemataceae bacterium]|nr:V-type ATP synthase subunit D [Rectinemataceae bacterium]
MPTQTIAPTKSNLLKEKENLALAVEGYELLERKREILMMELMKRVDQVRVLEREIDERAHSAYPVMRRMILSIGREKARELAEGMKNDLILRETMVQAAGQHIPSLETVVPDRKLQSSFTGSSVDTDETVSEFTALLERLVEMAGLRTVVWRLAREVKKTQRRVNALDKIVIPESRARKAFIESSLEERERDAIFATKLLKARGEAKEA